MAQIRETINFLCNILRSNGTCKINPESFRLAKFNNNECVSIWWRLLFDLTCLCKKGVITEPLVEKAAGQLSTEEMAEYVKKELGQYGMLSPDFWSLPSDMSRGSRELLIAFAWLLYNESIIERFMLPPCVEPSLLLPFHDPHDSAASRASTVSQDSTSSVCDVASRVKQLLLLRGKVDHRLRALHALQRQQSKLEHRIAKSTYGVSVDGEKEHLSAAEVHMLLHPRAYTEILKAIEKDNERLKNLLKWKTHEDTFWNWMLTVLELKSTEQVVVEEGECSTMWPVVSCGEINRMQSMQNDLHDTIIKYQSVIENLEHIWHNKRRTIRESELDALLVSINTEVTRYKALLSSEHVPRPPPLPPAQCISQFCYSSPETHKVSADSRQKVDTKVIGSGQNETIQVTCTNRMEQKSCPDQIGDGEVTANPCFNLPTVRNSRKEMPRHSCDVIDLIDSGMVDTNRPVGGIANGYVPEAHLADNLRYISLRADGKRGITSRTCGERADIATEISRLSSLVGDLESALISQQKMFLSDLEAMAAEMKSVVCLPPMGRKH